MTENLPDTNVGNIEYISKQDAIKCIELMTWYHVNGRGQLVDGATTDTGLYKAKDVYKGLHGIPAADVAPVVHGKWIDEDPAFAEYFANCSVCGYEIDVHNERGYFNFCPNCGAKMDGKG